MQDGFSSHYTRKNSTFCLNQVLSRESRPPSPHCRCFLLRGHPGARYHYLVGHLLVRLLGLGRGRLLVLRVDVGLSGVLSQDRVGALGRVVRARLDGDLAETLRDGRRALGVRLNAGVLDVDGALGHHLGLAGLLHVDGALGSHGGCDGALDVDGLHLLGACRGVGKVGRSLGDGGGRRIGGAGDGALDAGHAVKTDFAVAVQHDTHVGESDNVEDAGRGELSQSFCFAAQEGNEAGGGTG